MQNDLRIAVIIDNFCPDINSFVWRHIKALSADVIVENLYEDGLKHRGWRPHVAYLYKEKRSQESLARHMLKRLKEVCFGIAAPRWPNGMGDIWDRYMRERRADVALAEFAPNGMKALEACQRHKIPLVTHFHGYDASSLLRIKSYRQCLPDLFKNSAAIVVVSRHMRRTLERLGCPSPKLNVIPCGAPLDEFPLSNAVYKQPCRFLAVSSFTPMKGTLYTLRAFAHCVDYCPDVSLTMIGDGKQFQKAKTWVNRAGMSNKVHFLSHQPIKVVQEYMSRSSAFVQHSVTTRIGHVEGWGVSIAEAASAGLPVIATNHGGIPDQVIDGETGFLVEERDWKTMADRMILLANNPELRRKMGLAGRRNIEQVGNLELQVQKLERVLLKVASRSEY